MEFKLVQELASVDQDPLFLIFLDLQKAYDTVDLGRLLVTLEVYCSGPHMCWLLAVFWCQQEVFTWKNRYHAPHFKVTRGILRAYSYLPPSSA